LEAEDDDEEEELVAALLAARPGGGGGGGSEELDMSRAPRRFYVVSCATFVPVPCKRVSVASKAIATRGTVL
jgi:hypothetical protein